MKTLILASSSPRRSEILKRAGYGFLTFSLELSENIDENMSLDDALLALSRQKAEAVYQTFGGEIPKDAVLLSADTSVVLEGEVLGKPKDRKQAREYLTSLANKGQHVVKTAFCLFDLETSEIIGEVCNSHVFFKKISAYEIEEYLDTSEAYDKAGAYGIQGEGRKFVKSFEGSFYNIMGLPIERIEEIFKQKNWRFEKRK